MVKCGKQNLLGRKSAIELDVPRIGLPSTTVGSVEAVQNNCGQFPSIKGFEVRIETDPTVTPVAQHARRVPLALRQRVEEELKKMLDAGAWVSPLVVVPKGTNRGVRICSDMRLVNQAVKRKFHLIPTIDDFLASFYGAKYFSK